MFSLLNPKKLKRNKGKLKIINIYIFILKEIGIIFKNLYIIKYQMALIIAVE